MSNLTATEENKKELATAAQDMSAWGAAPVNQKDIIIPRIQLMQPMSEKVTAGDAAFGEIRESLNNDLLGGFEEPIGIIPFMMKKVWMVFNANNSEEPEYMETVDITPENEDLKYEDEIMVEGVPTKISRIRTMNFFVLLEKELLTGAAIPYILSFSKTSLKAGKKLATQMYVKNANAGVIPPGIICQLSSQVQKQDKRSWAVFDIEPGKKTPEDWCGTAFHWFKVINEGKAKIDEKAFTEDVKQKDVTPSEPQEPGSQQEF